MLHKNQDVHNRIFGVMPNDAGNHGVFPAGAKDIAVKAGLWSSSMSPMLPSANLCLVVV